MGASFARTVLPRTGAHRTIARRVSQTRGSRQGCRICRLTTRGVHFRGCCPHCGRAFGEQRPLTTGEVCADLRRAVCDRLSFVVPQCGPALWVIGHAALAIAFGVAALGKIVGP